MEIPANLVDLLRKAKRFADRSYHLIEVYNWQTDQVFSQAALSLFEPKLHVFLTA